jgi:competence protein ComEC
VKQIGWLLVAIAMVSIPRSASAQRRTLDIYFIDVEGGQSTLIVTPAGESLLIDGGFPGADGTFASVSGDPHKARDANRVLAAARAAGITRIDDLLITHYHADHFGAIPELAQLIPIRTFIDHAAPEPDAESRVPGTLAAYERYAAVRAKGKHLLPKPGDHLPLRGVDVTVVSAAGATITTPLPGAGGANTACGNPAVDAQEPTENPRSTSIRLRYGRFTFLDVGDLTGAPLRALACPTNMIGPTDVYLVAHHAGPDAADLATFAAFAPRVAILNNGTHKGGSAEVLAALHKVSGLEDAWQLHRSLPPGPRFFADDRVANLDESTAYWIKVSARSDGSFTVTNARTGATKAYGPRSGTTRPTAPAVPK